MVDSSVGGKTGINLSVENLVELFTNQAKCLLIWMSSTLPIREFAAGMAEVIKYGMLGNLTLFQKLLALEEPLSRDNSELGRIIYQCCADKAEIVREDERESAQGEGIAQPGSYFWACNRSSCWIRFIPSWGGSFYRFGLCFPIISKVGVLRK